MKQAEESAKPRKRLTLKHIVFLSTIAVFLITVIIALFEAKTSRLQARYFAKRAAACEYHTDYGESSEIRFPGTGPFNQRRGYTLIPSFVQTLKPQGFEIERQAFWSQELITAVDKGLNPIYKEKKSAGLCVYDMNRRLLSCERFPLTRYSTFESIPPVIVRTILFIEDRKLLDSTNLFMNPAVNWPRFLFAAVKYLGKKAGLRTETPGASTIAVQLEKYRYSPDGLTENSSEKIRQIKSASMRAYLQGKNTMQVRKEILLDYINNTPLAASPGYGEVNGLGPGLQVWYGVSLDTVSYLLRKIDLHTKGLEKMSGHEWKEAGRYFRMVLSLFIAHRRPNLYLITKPDLLTGKTEKYLRLLDRKKIIPHELVLSALESQINLKEAPSVVHENRPFSLRKSANIVRTPMLRMLKLPSMYDLDRFDLTVESVLDGQAQIAVGDFFEHLQSRRALDSLGLRGVRMLEKGDPQNIIYSLTLYEHVSGINFLRVQADSYTNPLNINEGTKLDLGSTAKLRTLITYLEIIERLHNQLVAMTRQELKKLQFEKDDHLSLWASRYILSAKDTALSVMLDAALNRTYSANPHAKFFTGNGLHVFSNFNPKDNYRIMTVREGLINSVNLVFIRLMKDIVNYYIYRIPSVREMIKEPADSPVRKEYLKRFVEYEGRIYVNRFYKQLKGVPADKLVDTLISSIRPTPARIAVTYCSVVREARAQQLAALLRKYNVSDTSELAAARLIQKYGYSQFSLSDRGYLAGIHPLKLWIARYLSSFPQAMLPEVKDSSVSHMEDVYHWLFKTKRAFVQNQRIRMILEMDAFVEIHRTWQRLGYPFHELVPSYATALGASADRPSALAELTGIIQNNGIRYPNIRVKRLRFAEDTPFETILRMVPVLGERVLSAEIAQTVRHCLIDVVEQGTAQRVKGSFVSHKGTVIPIGGKTGTGDHRYKMYDHNGVLVKEKVMNRTATFMFIIGDRFFGTISVMVPGEKAVEYRFTSSYPVQLLKLLSPLLQLINQKPEVSSDEVKRIFSGDNIQHAPDYFLQNNDIFNTKPYKTKNKDSLAGAHNSHQ